MSRLIHTHSASGTSFFAFGDNRHTASLQSFAQLHRLLCLPGHPCCKYLGQALLQDRVIPICTQLPAQVSPSRLNIRSFNQLRRHLAIPNLS